MTLPRPQPSGSGEVNIEISQQRLLGSASPNSAGERESTFHKCTITIFEVTS